uniref:Protein kinase domain-containing protein n=3 Tax=Physcomitrium patens TaxID=3218 RepID=A0A2K1JZ63_PHYPA|nr:hypothetical protein PHYPA_013934 [Physcomitrium patens]
MNSIVFVLLVAVILLSLYLGFGPSLQRRKFQINVELCMRLEKKLAKTQTHIHDQYDPLKMTGIQKKIYQELKAVMKRATDLLKQCRCSNRKSWLCAAVALLDIKEHVLDIELELAWCTRMLKLSTTSHLDSTVDTDEDSNVAKAETQQKSLYDKLSDDLEDLQKAANKDKAHLLSKLEKEVSKHDKGSEHHLLVTYLQCRLKELQGNSIPDGDVKCLDEYFGKKVQLVESVGEGAYGYVYKTKGLEHLNIPKQAVKIILEPNALEGKFLKFCYHPHIVQYFWSWEQIVTDRIAIDKMKNCFLEDEKYSYILMELMRTNLTLEIWENKQKNPGSPPFALPVAIDIMLQIAKAMRYLHGKRITKSKITHRDLKPANILVETQGNSLHVKLVDFGISKVYQHTETLGAQTRKLGTTVYAAPEVFLPAENGTTTANYPPRADVWSFAMTCSEILTGRTPFHRVLERKDLHEKIKDGLRPDLPDNLPDCLRFCIESCWNLDPQQRPNFQNICRMLTVAKAVSLNATLAESAFKHVQKLGDPSLQIASKPSRGVGETYVLVGTSFTLYTDSSRKVEIKRKYSKGITTDMDEYKYLNPIQIPFVQGSIWANQLDVYAHGCLCGVFVSSKYQDQLRKLNLNIVTGGYLGQTNSTSEEDEDRRHYWGVKRDKNSSEYHRAAGFFNMRESNQMGYVYVYFRYGSSDSAVITHIWQDDTVILGDIGTADSAYADRMVLGSKILHSAPSANSHSYYLTFFHPSC